MQTPSRCPQCGLELGRYVETHCPQCGVSFAPKPPVTVGLWLLDLTIAISATLFVMGCVFGLPLYLNSSSSAELYAGQPYHATTFRVTSVQYGQTADPFQIWATGNGMVEGKREMMDLMPYLGTLPDYNYKLPTSQVELMTKVPEGTVIPVYAFPNLKGANRIQLIQARPTAENYSRLAAWTSNRAFPVVALLGTLTALLGLTRYVIWRFAVSRVMAS